VGDTPQDILAALDAGATAIGVATGIYTKEQLEQVAPGRDVVVLPGLADVEKFLDVVGL
jgi:phosphoglycolate phosphatase-like HAD superfamily hydrolase